MTSRLPIHLRKGKEGQGGGWGGAGGNGAEGRGGSRRGGRRGDGSDGRKLKRRWRGGGGRKECVESEDEQEGEGGGGGGSLTEKRCMFLSRSKCAQRIRWEEGEEEGEEGEEGANRHGRGGMLQRGDEAPSRATRRDSPCGTSRAAPDQRDSALS